MRIWDALSIALNAVRAEEHLLFDEWNKLRGEGILGRVLDSKLGGDEAATLDIEFGDKLGRVSRDLGRSFGANLLLQVGVLGANLATFPSFWRHCEVLVWSAAGSQRLETAEHWTWTCC